jgi:hypothetical protein
MSGMINEKRVKGVVSAYSKGKLWVVPSTDCAQHPSCTVGCGVCGGTTPRRRIMVETDHAARYTPGTPVIVRSFELNEAAGALIVFGIPLLSAVAVLMVWYAVDPSSAESGRSLACAGFAFCGGLLVVRFIDRLFRKRFPSMIITSEPRRDSGIPSQRVVHDG